MKINKPMQLLLVFCVLFSCSQDTVVEQTANEPETRIAVGHFDTSYLGLYKGLFTTEDGLTRGSVEVTLNANNEGIAKLTLSSGEQIELKSSRVKLTVDNTVSNLRFSSEGLSATSVTLEFSVHADGSEPAVSNVSFDNQASDILIAKNLSRAPLTPITGTYVRTAGTGGFPTSGRTWNIMSIGAGDPQNFAVQVAYGGRVYTSAAENNVQTSCQDYSDYSTCTVSGSISILGYDVFWDGNHIYSPSSAAPCSSASGVWFVSEAPGGGSAVGLFTSDVDSADCVVPPPVYEEVVIGTQTWMLKNLEVETYRNGDPIPQVQDATEWANLTTGAWCYYNNDPANGPIYGKLYNAYAVNDPRGLAPEGYYVPGWTQYGNLISQVGGNSVAGGPLKSTSTLWSAPNSGATNSSGFTALPGGYRNETGAFLNLGENSSFWSTLNYVTYQYYTAMNYNSMFSSNNNNRSLKTGLSVRCLKL